MKADKYSDRYVEFCWISNQKLKGHKGIEAQ